MALTVKHTFESAVPDSGDPSQVSSDEWNGTGAHTIEGTASIVQGGTGAATAADARTSLGLAIGSDVQAFNADLSALAALSGTGLLVRTGAATYALRTITGTANQVTVANGDGVSGNPTLSLPQDIHTGASPTFAAVTVSDEAYDATGWNGDLTVPTKNAVRDKIESLAAVNVYGLVSGPMEDLLAAWQADISATRPRAVRTALLDNLLGDLEDAGLLAKLDFLYVFGQHAERNALYDVLNATRALPTETGSLTFTADVGYSGGSASNYLDLGFGRTDLTNFTQNSAHIGVFLVSGVNATGKAIQAGSNCFLIPFNGGDVVAAINQAAPSVAAVSSAIGHTVVVRTGASALTIYKDSISVGTDTDASTSVDATNFRAFGDTASYQPQAVVFDGSNDYLTRGANLTGLSDGKAFTFSCWIDLAGGDGASQILCATTNGRFQVVRATDNKIKAFGSNSAGTSILSIATVNTYVAATSWVHVLVSVDLATSAEHIYINDVADLAVTTSTNDNIDFTDTDFAVGANPAGASKLNASVYDLWLTNTYIDLSVTANRRKFISATGQAVDLGPSGEYPTGTQPLVFFSGDQSTFGTNLGTGGAFTEFGDLTDGTDPSASSGSNEAFAIHGGAALDATDVQNLFLILTAYAQEVGAI